MVEGIKRQAPAWLWFREKFSRKDRIELKLKIERNLLLGTRIVLYVARVKMMTPELLLGAGTLMLQTSLPFLSSILIVSPSPGTNVLEVPGALIKRARPLVLAGVVGVFISAVAMSQGSYFGRVAEPVKRLFCTRQLVGRSGHPFVLDNSLNRSDLNIKAKRVWPYKCLTRGCERL